MFAMNPRERVTKDKVIASVLEIFKERSNIAASLSNTESMMDSLHAGLGGALHFLFIGFYLLIWYPALYIPYIQLTFAILNGSRVPLHPPQSPAPSFTPVSFSKVMHVGCSTCVSPA
jgi:hypothetical protein